MSIEIANIGIRQDKEGRYSLNDLHRASGNEDRHSPRRWLCLDSTVSLVHELDKDVKKDGIPSILTKQGLGTFACLELVYDYAAWISPSFKIDVYRTFHSVKTGGDIANRIPVEKTPALFKGFFSVAKLLGLDKNAAAISANQAVLSVTGSNVLGLLGQTHLESESQDQWFKVTDIGAQVGLSAVAMNRVLCDARLQHRVDDTWVPTSFAEGLYRIFDVGKAHGNGTPVTQVKWSLKVLSDARVLEVLDGVAA